MQRVAYISCNPASWAKDARMLADAGWDTGLDLGLLARAEAIVVTSDSVNMVSEAVATGAPVLLCGIEGTPARHERMYAALAQAGALAPFDGRLTDLRYSPIDATPVIAQALADAYIARRRGRD